MRNRLFFVFFLSILLGTSGLMASEESLRLDLNPEDIAEVRFTDKSAIHLKLSESATLKLKHLTEQNIGKKLSVYYRDHAIITATVQAMIPSGRITISEPSDSIWEEMKILQGHLRKKQN